MRDRVYFNDGPLAGFYVKRSLHTADGDAAPFIWVLRDREGATGVHRGHPHIIPPLDEDERVLGAYEYCEFEVRDARDSRDARCDTTGGANRATFAWRPDAGRPGAPPAAPA